MVESCIELFDEKVNFVVIPAGMALHYGDAVLNEELLKKEGDSIYVYGNLKVPEDVKLDTLDEWISKLMVKETVLFDTPISFAISSSVIKASCHFLLNLKNSYKRRNGRAGASDLPARPFPVLFDCFI